MNQNVFIYLILSLFLVGCSGISREGVTPVPFGQVPTSEEQVAVVPVDPEVTNTPSEEEVTVVAIPPTEAATTITPLPEIAEEESTPEPPVFRSLRFATEENGISQVTFLSGTQEIYALWDYAGITNGDTMRRVWYLNDELYVERPEAWNSVNMAHLAHDSMFLCITTLMVLTQGAGG